MNSILAVDIGSGTQDILVYQPGLEMENNIKMILPSQTQIVARQIERLTEEGKDIFIHGYLMGGGSSSGAVKKHLQKGYKVYATREAALPGRSGADMVDGYRGCGNNRQPGGSPGQGSYGKRGQHAG